MTEIIAGGFGFGFLWFFFFGVWMVPLHGVTWVMLFPLAPAVSRPLMMKVLYCFSPLLGKLSLPPPSLPSPAKSLPSKQLWAEFLSKMNLNFHMLCGTGYTNTALRGSQLRGARPESLCRCVKWVSLLRCLTKLKSMGKKKLKMHATCFS